MKPNPIAPGYPMPRQGSKDPDKGDTEREASRVSHLIWKTIWGKILWSIMVAVVTGSLTLAASQFTRSEVALDRVTKSEADISLIKEALRMEIEARKHGDEGHEKAMTAQIALISRSIDRITASLDKQTSQNTELIALNTQLLGLIRSQNQWINNGK